MKKVLLILGIAICLIAIFWFRSSVPEVVPTATPDDSLVPKYERVVYKSHTFHVVHVDLLKQDLNMYYKNAKGERYGTIDILKKELQDRGENLVFATNGGIYAEDFSPLGLYIEDCERISALNTSKASTGNFFIQPNGVFEIFPTTHALYTTEEWSSFKYQCPLYAVQAGPMLVINDVINSNFTANSENRLIRSGVGSISNFEAAFVLSEDPVNFYEFAAFFRDRLKAERALYLDGTISNLYVDGKSFGHIQGEYSTIIGVTIHE